MIRKLFTQIAEKIGTAEPDTAGRSRETALRLATATLLVEVARADHHFDESEFDELIVLVRSHFDLDAEHAADLVNRANDKADDIVSVHELTQFLHEHLDEEEKAEIVRLLWKIAYADGRLDKYEDSLVLKISDLLYVSRGRVMRLKYDAGLAAG